MSPRRSWTVLAAAALMAACQAAPPAGAPPSPGGATSSPGPAASVPAPGASAVVPPTSPGPSPSASPSASPTAAPVVDREIVLGSIYNDNQGQVENARVRIDASDDAFDREIDAAGGAYALRDVPVGTVVSITAFAPGFGERTRTITVRKPVPFVDESPNRVDFGGFEPAGYWYFLWDEPEISRTEPANQAKDVPVDQLEVVFHFSEAIDADELGLFEKLVRVTVPSRDGSAMLTTTTAVGKARLRFTWSEGNRTCTMRFPLPIVARLPGAAVTVDFDPSAEIEDWPKGETSDRLGFDVVAVTSDGTGSKRTNRVAPLARPIVTDAMPSTRPSPEILWGTTHMTSMRFEPRRDLTPPKIKSVRALPGNDEDEDLIEIIFDKPMFGFPRAGLSEEVERESNYKLVYGDTTERETREAFEEADPSRTGGIPSGGVEFDEDDPYVLILHDSKGSFGDRNRFKLWIDPKVEDIYGASVGSEGIHWEGEL